MDLDTFRFMLLPFVQFFGPLIVGTFGSSALVQLVKARQIPIPATKFPRITNAVISTVAATATIYLSKANLVLVEWWQWGAFILGWILLSAMWYMNVFKGLNPNSQ